VPRYYFHLHDEASLEDEEGTDLADVAAVRDYALANARDMVCGDIKNGFVNLDHRIEVVDEDGELVFTITFGEAFKIERLGPADDEAGPPARYFGH
jgi:hypothetical protein